MYVGLFTILCVHWTVSYSMCTLDCLLYYVYIHCFLYYVYTVFSSVCLVGALDSFLYYMYSVFSPVCLVGTLDFFLYYVYTGLFPILCVHCIFSCLSVHWIFLILLYYVYIGLFPILCVQLIVSYIMCTLDCFLYYVYT